MKIDLRDAELLPQPLSAKVCVIGGGIAGLVLAHRLAQRGVDVLLLEAGGPEPQNPDPAAAVEMLGHPHRGSLERPSPALGGSSLTWGGQLLPLPPTPGQADDNDPDTSFREALHQEPIPSDLAPPWPVSQDTLRPFQAEAECLLGVNNLPYDASAFFQATQSPGPALIADSPWLSARLSKFAPFTHRNLAQTLGRELLAHPHARVVLHAPVTELRLDLAGSPCLHAAIVRSSTGQLLPIHADHFVLAAGTLETVRLLLASHAQQPAGLGNTHDQLGRNVHDHLTLTAATFAGAARARILHQLRPWIFPGPAGSVLHSLKLESSAALQRRWPGSPVMAHLTVEEPPDSGIDAVRTLLHARQRHTRMANTLRNLLPRLPSSLASAAQLAWSARVHHRRFVSPHATVSLRLNAAQQPSASRITLSSRTSASGDPLAALRWEITPHDLDTLRAFAQLLRSQPAFKTTGTSWIPELLSALGGPPPPSLEPLLDDARHLMGGALLGTDPRSSVVDPNLQVHGLTNLHIASLATFPDGRAQLPTLTLMALALRLAERLASALR